MTDVDWSVLRARIAKAEAATQKLLAPTAEENEKILEARARRLAARAEPAPEAEVELAFFLAGGESFAIETRGVHSVMSVRDVEPIPRAPAAFRGATSHRGDVLPVIDLGALITGHRSSVGDETLLVLGLDRAELGLAVDEPECVVRVPLTELRREGLPARLQSFAFVRAVHGGHRVVIDVDALLQDSRSSL